MGKGRRKAIDALLNYLGYPAVGFCAIFCGGACAAFANGSVLTLGTVQRVLLSLLVPENLLGFIGMVLFSCIYLKGYSNERHNGIPLLPMGLIEALLWVLAVFIVAFALFDYIALGIDAIRVLTKCLYAVVGFASCLVYAHLAGEGGRKGKLSGRVRFALIWPAIYVVGLGLFQGYTTFLRTNVDGSGFPDSVYAITVDVLAILYLLLMLKKTRDGERVISMRHLLAIAVLLLICWWFGDLSAVWCVIAAALLASYEAWDLTRSLYLERLGRNEEGHANSTMGDLWMKYAIATNVVYAVLLAGMPFLFHSLNASLPKIATGGADYGLGVLFMYYLLIYASVLLFDRKLLSLDEGMKRARKWKIVFSAVAMAMLVVIVAEPSFVIRLTESLHNVLGGPVSNTGGVTVLTLLAIAVDLGLLVLKDRQGEKRVEGSGSNRGLDSAIGGMVDVLRKALSPKNPDGNSLLRNVCVVASMGAISVIALYSNGGNSDGLQASVLGLAAVILALFVDLLSVMAKVDGEENTGHQGGGAE